MVLALIQILKFDQIGTERFDADRFVSNVSAEVRGDQLQIVGQLRQQRFVVAQRRIFRQLGERLPRTLIRVGEVFEEVPDRRAQRFEVGSGRTGLRFDARRRKRVAVASDFLQCPYLFDFLNVS